MFKKKPLPEPTEPTKAENPWSLAVNKLHRGTVEGSVKWQVGSFKTIDTVDSPMYWTTLCNHTIVVYRYKYKNYITGDRFHWKTDFTIQIADESECTFRWPFIECCASLFWAIGKQVAGANEFLTKYLAD